jgi:hypothetical protein
MDEDGKPINKAFLKALQSNDIETTVVGFDMCLGQGGNEFCVWVYDSYDDAEKQMFPAGDGAQAMAALHLKMREKARGASS